MAGGQQTAIHLSDVSIVQRIAEGDELAVADLYDRWAEAIYRFAYRRVGQVHEDAEVIALETLISAVTLAPTFNGSCGVFTWLCGDIEASARRLL